MEYLKPLTIDYRNGRFQGCMKNNKRNGVGIMVDDDLNFSCCEWEDDKISGMVYMQDIDNNYMFGNWSNNEPHGLNVFVTKQFTIFCNFIKGQACNSAMVIDEANNHMMVINGESMNQKQKKIIQTKSFIQISDIKIIEQLILLTAQKNNIQISKYQTSIIKFLSEFKNKYNNVIEIHNNQNNIYFGYRQGLGIKFNLIGKRQHKLKMISLGHHQYQFLSEYGIKYHDARCFEQGNFQNKQTISYNNILKRPTQKCHILYQNIHKKSLSFINQYIQNNNNHLHSIQKFIQNKLILKFQKQIELNFKRPKIIQKNQNQQHFDQNKKINEQLKISENKQLIRNKSKSQINNKYRVNKQLKQNQQILQKQIKKPLLKTSSKLMLTPQNNNINYQHEGQCYLNDTHQMIQDIYPHRFKKPITCKKCKSKQKRRITLTNQKYLKKTTPSKSPIKKQQSPKKIKYLVSYQKQHKNNKKQQKGIIRSSNEKKQYQNIQRQFEKQVDIPEQNVKYTITKNQSIPNIKFRPQYRQNKKQTLQDSLQYQNQKKIRNELYQKQLQKNIKRPSYSYLQNIQYEIPLKNITNIVPAYIQPNIYPLSMNYIKPTLDIKQQLNYNFSQIQKRRLQLQQQYLKLNQKNIYDNTHRTQFYDLQQQLNIIKQIDHSKRNRALQFNNNYRFYLQNDSNNRKITNLSNFSPVKPSKDLTYNKSMGKIRNYQYYFD